MSTTALMLTVEVSGAYGGLGGERGVGGGDGCGGDGDGGGTGGGGEGGGGEGGGGEGGGGEGVSSAERSRRALSVIGVPTARSWSSSFSSRWRLGRLRVKTSIPAP